MNNLFHLAFPVKDLEESRKFYGEILGCEEGRSSAEWIDFNLFGHQIVAHLAPEAAGVRHRNEVDADHVPVPHFGVVLPMDEFKNLAGKLKEKGNSNKLGIRSGEWITYYESGKIKVREKFKNGSPTGDREYFDENGKPYKLWKSYYDTGELKELGNYDENGLKIGDWRIFYRNGNYKEKGTYVGGMKRGEWLYFAENGRLSLVEKNG